jgi:hypothetical protein
MIDAGRVYANGLHKLEPSDVKRLPAGRVALLLEELGGLAM